ncbi:hypothetical protein [Nannocystis pusilla]|uniref:Uncharacterized protein n=1 Tax=Nannocystis pusilla TaxID=889268 RepID=A0ABS7TKF4_9BACT|nr:hypothetical protein [Nannocystis pusilla]MBZ5708689.1 hypothetical protein [Nannocystis pusilla]
MRSFSLACFAFLLLACPSKSSETDSDTGGATETGTGTSDGTAPTSTTTTSTTASSVTEGADTTTVPTPTTGEPLEPLPAACEKLCAAMDACGFGGGPQCAEQCVEDEAPASECEGRLADLWNCVAELSCADLEHQVMVEPHMCTAEVEAYDQCNIPDCAIQSNGDAESCFIKRDCEGVVQELRCEGDTCTCLEDEVPGKTCPSKDICASIPPSTPEVDAKQCCEWDWQ